MNETTETPIGVSVEALNRLGIRLMLPDDFSDYEIRSSASLNMALKDREAEFASRYGCSVDIYRQAVAVRREGRCTGITKQGHRCNNGVDSYGFHPGNFIPGRSDRCRQHWDISENTDRNK
jgi:hypothetical protein